ncbi:collagen alpha-2(I) chain-like isoform X1 [Canis lupus familiaris]|uniref:collagen alpha-2(I) chain-like isoform X1 n=1 Tax=Canis lupus familiaris TaxID=9615 RepID=UPI0006B3D2C7|nr:collagen alpha-2(I) chain-like isoform X1 [Canis lupus familiaris]XP_038307269.1 collagen alpha-2(I) chain-like isoform X1 [Canis lupus familiaris]XP_038307271.1 collagen alpha-2(I) chain-like isoform X1 [Canis lupus familiaris]|eukprot:XP_005629496.2 collagen alpha-2(I) chain-like [Canis lupus familiaris]
MTFGFSCYQNPLEKDSQEANTGRPGRRPRSRVISPPQMPGSPRSPGASGRRSARPRGFLRGEEPACSVPRCWTPPPGRAGAQGGAGALLITGNELPTGPAEDARVEPAPGCGSGCGSGSTPGRLQPTEASLRRITLPRRSPRPGAQGLAEGRSQQPPAGAQVPGCYFPRLTLRSQIGRRRFGRSLCVSVCPAVSARPLPCLCTSVPPFLSSIPRARPSPRSVGPSVGRGGLASQRLLRCGPRPQALI